MSDEVSFFHSLNLFTLFHPLSSLRYENLATDANTTMERVCDFLHEPFVASDVFAHRRDTVFNGVSGAEITSKPINEAKQHDQLRAYVCHSLMLLLLLASKQATRLHFTCTLLF